MLVILFKTFQLMNSNLIIYFLSSNSAISLFRVKFEFGKKDRVQVSKPGYALEILFGVQNIKLEVSCVERIIFTHKT